MSEEAEKAWEAHKESLYRSNAVFGPKHPFVVGYDAGRDSRDAKLESLTTQLQAAQATIAEALSYFGDGGTAYIAKVLRRADTSNPEQSPKDLFYKNIRSMNPNDELNAAIDNAEARDHE